MEKRASFTYSIENNNNNITKEIQYSDYSKQDNEESMLLYKNVMRNNDIMESFNKICKSDDDVDEIIGNSKNKSDWKIKQFKNNMLHKKYREDYNRLKFNINPDMIEKMECQNTRYIKGIVSSSLIMFFYLLFTNRNEY